MTPAELEQAARSVRQADIPGIERVFADDQEDVVWLVCAPGTDPSAAATAAVAAAGEVEVEVRPLQRAGTTRTRVRLDGASCAAVDERTRRAEVKLEWRGESYTATAVGEPGAAIELRLVAEAALQAIHRLRPEVEDIRLVGVKPTRAFDADLMVASLYRAGPPAQRLVGAVLVGDDPQRAAAAAVLGALNRLLGNYLSTR
jgi:hypothetical protein